MDGERMPRRKEAPRDGNVSRLRASPRSPSPLPRLSPRFARFPPVPLRFTGGYKYAAGYASWSKALTLRLGVLWVGRSPVANASGTDLDSGTIHYSLFTIH